MSRNPFLLSLIVACFAGVILFRWLENRTPIGGDHPVEIAINR